MRALVLAAGYGTRLGDLTRDLPKPMLPLQGRPLLEYILHHLRRHGFNQVAINLHFHPEVIRDYFGDGSSMDMELSYSIERTLLGTAGALKQMEPFLAEEEIFLVQYGDVLTDQDLGLLVECQRTRQALAALIVHSRPESNSVVTFDQAGCIHQFLERPTAAERRGVASQWVNSGICVCAREILQHIPAGVPSDLPRDIFCKLVSTGRLYAVPLSGYRCAIDSAARFAEAESALADGRCQPGTRPPSMEADP